MSIPFFREFALQVIKALFQLLHILFTGFFISCQYIAYCDSGSGPYQ